MADRIPSEASETVPQVAFHSYAATDPGRVRSNNEDEVFADDEHGIYFVVDGMGGHAAGERAAGIAKDHLRGRLQRALGSPEQRVREAIVLANNSIYETALANPAWNGMACVLTVAVIERGEAIVGHVGDSRLYLFHGGEMFKVTRDHSPVGLLEDSQQLSEQEAMEHPRRNEVYRDVGTAPHDTEDEQFIDIYRVPAPPDSALLLCSDGLTDALRSSNIAEMVRRYAGNCRKVVEELIQRAVAVGKDNVSVVYVEGPRFTDPASAAEVEPATHVTFASHPDPDITAPNPTSQPERERPSSEDRPKSRSRLAAWVIGTLLFAAGGGAMWLAEHGRDLLRGASQTAQPPHVLQVDAQGQNGLPTIQAALDQANSGDSIQIAPGVYREAIVLTKDLTISGSGVTILPPENTGPVAAISVLAPAKVRPVNLSIAGNEASGNLLQGVVIEGGSAVLQKVTITSAARAGIEVSGNGAATIEYSSLHNNTGPGALIRESGSAVLRFNSVAGNGHGASNRAPGVEIDSERPVELVGNTFVENGAEAIWDVRPLSKQVLAANLFGAEGRTGRADDVRVMPPKGSR